MAAVDVTTAYVTARESGATPGTYVDTNTGFAPVKVIQFDFAQGAAAGDAASFQRLTVLPAGKIRVLGFYLARTAFGASRVLDVGYEAHKNTAGTTVAASATAFADDIDVSAAGGAFTWLNTTLDSQSGIVIRSVVAGGTIPAATTLKGYFLIAG